MKFRWMAWIVSGLIVSVSVFPSVSQADSTSLTQLFPALAGVQLRPEQQSQLESLSEQTLPQVRRLLTLEQQSQFNDALSLGKGVRAAVLSLNLSVAQRWQIFNLLKTARSQLTLLLTSEQQRQIQENIQTLQQGH